MRNLKKYILQTIKDHGTTLKFLSDYDKGKVPEPKSVANCKTLKEYLETKKNGTNKTKS